MNRHALKRITAVLLCMLISSSAFASHVNVHFSENQSVELRKEEGENYHDLSKDSTHAELIETESEFITEAETETGTESETESETEPETESEPDGKFPAQHFKKTTGAVTVSVKAPEGAFPTGTTMSVRDVENEETISAIEEVVSSQIRRIHAVDIAFHDVNGREVRPLLPVSVTMTAEEKKEDEDTLVVHVDDDLQAEQIPVADISAENVADVNVENEEEPVPSSDSDKTGIMRKENPAGFGLDQKRKLFAAASDQSLRSQTATEELVSEKEGFGDNPEGRASVQFTTDRFSVYALVYTVDFHWEVNGKVYEFSIPGGGFVSFSKLAELLGISKAVNSNKNPDQNESENSEEIVENGEETPGQESENAAPEGAEEGGIRSYTDTTLTLDDVEVSEDTRNFVTAVKEITFSKPELVDVSRADSRTTVGQIKESRGLDCEYSAELTEEQIEEINAQMVEDGDWVLISLHPFDTEEMLTVTMKDGEQFSIRVTDASAVTNKVTELDGKTVALVNLRNNNSLQSFAHTAAGRLKAVAINYNASTNTVSTTQTNEQLTKWTFEKVAGAQNQYYIKSAKGYLNIDNNTTGLSVTGTPQALTVQQKADGTIRIKRTDNNRAVNNTDNNTAAGYGVYGSDWDANPGEWFTAFELSNVISNIALNPMNENGILRGNPDSGNVTSTHYKNMTIDGYTIDNNNDANLDKARIYIPVAYNDDGTAEITLPSDAQLGSFSVSDADSVTHSITQDPDKYQLVLHGWINIATGEYYDVTGGPVTATVSQENLNVFYADWWAADYSYTIPESQRADTVDTSSFVTIKMWDYNEMFNLHGSDVWKVDGDQRRYIPRDSLESEEWYIKNGPYFQFVDNTDPANCWQYGTLGNTQDRGRYNQWSNYSYSGTLGILGDQGQVPNTGVLESLFPANVTPGSGVNYLGNGNYLFSYDENTRTYSYDSSRNAAVYNQNDQRFYVSNTDKKYYRGPGYYQSSVGGFFPLNDNAKTLSYNDGTINNWLGISIDLDFWLPDTPGSSTTANLLAGEHMRFDFTGDDDVWVLIDGKLALDIGGIHEAVGGYIDFTTGEIRNAKGDTYRLSDMGIGAGAHTLSFYYLEQGGNASNCKITFNIAPRWDEDPVQKGTVVVTKRWSADTPEEAKEALSFSLQTSDGTPVEGTVVGYTDGTEEDGTWHYMWTGLDPGLEYEVVEAEDPRFVEVYTKEIIDVSNVWALASYHKDAAFGSDTIALGNGRRGSENGQLLRGNGDSDSADIDADIVRTEVSDSAKWTVDGYSPINQHFYLKNPSGKYLSIKNGSIALADSASAASWFYMSPSGDLNDAHSDYRLRVNESGQIVVGRIVNSADETDNDSPDRIHIYRHYDYYEKTTNYNYENTFRTKEVHVTKAWSDSQTVNHDSDTITIALYQIAVNSENEVVSEVEYPITAPNTDTITGSGTITISGLPVAGIYEEQPVTYQYRVAESGGKVGYVSQTHETSADNWTILNLAPDSQDQTTSVTVRKSWKHPNGTDAASDHENDVITFKILQRAVESSYVPVTIRWINGNNNDVAETQQYYIAKGGDLKFTVSRIILSNLGRSVTMTTDRGNTDRDTWTVRPLSLSHDFNVNNITDGITISVKLNYSGGSWTDSSWSRSVSDHNLVSSVSAVVTADASHETAGTEEYSYTLRKEEISEGPFEESATNWSASISGLPFYKKINSGTYYSYYYMISEISVNGEQVVPNGTTTIGSTEDFIVSIDQSDMAITNTEKEKTQAAAIKAWANVDGSSIPPAGAGVTFELYADGMATGKTVLLNGKEDVEADPADMQELITAAGNSADAYESPAWTAVWKNLQKYTYNADETVDHEIIYTIREVPDSIPEGYTADYGTDDEDQPKTEAVNGGTITNRQLSASLEILKVDAEEMETPLEGALFELRRIDPENLSYLDENPTLPETDREDHKTGTDGKASFNRLTSGYYEVKEAVLPPGYVLTGDSRFYIRIVNGTVEFVKKNLYGVWVSNDGNDKLVFTSASGESPASAKVGNEPGVALPSTGGPGTRLFTIFGNILMFAAGLLIWKRRRLIYHR